MGLLGKSGICGVEVFTWLGLELCYDSSRLMVHFF